MLRPTSALLCILFFTTCQTYVHETQPEWQPRENSLLTSWAAEVTPLNVHPEYPRPQLVREQWLTLNGLWDYTITPRGGTPPETYDGAILVPFPIESALSGVQKTVNPDQNLWYRRTFVLPPAWKDQPLLLHFGAVDWQAVIWVNGQKMGEHRGGYTPFTVDISDALADRRREQELVVEVWDPTDSAEQPVGKQALQPQGIWYTASTGIWRTVWLEPVPESHISRLKIVPNVDQSTLRVEAFTNDEATATRVRATARTGGETVATAEGGAHLPLPLSIPSPRLWSPTQPFLYDLQVELIDGDGLVIDQVRSYFGMRKIEIAKGKDGYNRLALNHQPLFQFGPLDQGFWPGGLYTAPSDEAMKYDLMMTKKMGFNMVRKHVKVEPDRWYYWCDKLGLLVWQDMPSGGSRVARDGTELIRNENAAVQFEDELRTMIDEYYNHPSVVMWVLFNEGWGQYDTQRLAHWASSYDTTRIINPASGWLDVGAGPVKDKHQYPGPGMPTPEDDRVAVLGEFGGQALAVADHLWVTDLTNAPTHFNTSKTKEALQQEYLALIKRLPPLIKKGLAAAVYTQTTDVESEVNGLMTYDRALLKINVDTLAAAHEKLY